MSYTVYTYLIELEELRGVFGSRDESVVHKIKSRYSADAKRHDRWFANEIGRGAPPLMRALQEIVEDKITAPEFAFQYGYALHLVCKELGNRLPGETFCDNRMVFDLPFGFPVISNGPPVSIPRIKEFPSIGHLSPEQVRVELNRHALKEAVLLQSDYEQMRLDYVEWLEEADRTEKGLVGFCF